MQECDELSVGYENVYGAADLRLAYPRKKKNVNFESFALIKHFCVLVLHAIL